MFTITQMKVTASSNARTRLTRSGAPLPGSINISWERPKHHRTNPLGERARDLFPEWHRKPNVRSHFDQLDAQGLGQPPSCHSLCFHAAATLKVGTKSGTDDANNVFWGRQAAVWNNTGDTATISDQTATVISTFYVLTAKVPSVVATRATAVANAMESTIASSAEPARPLSEGVYAQ